jgi:hypothetical protein
MSEIEQTPKKEQDVSVGEAVSLEDYGPYLI